MNNSAEEVVQVDPIIKMIIDRDCHVNLSNKEVIKHVISKMYNGYNSFKEMEKEDRRKFMKMCIHHHKENIELFNFVMRGF